MDRRLALLGAAAMLAGCSGGGATPPTSSATSTSPTTRAAGGGPPSEGELRDVLARTPLGGHHLEVTDATVADARAGHDPAVQAGTTYQPRECSTLMRAALAADSPPLWHATAVSEPTATGWVAQLDSYADAAAARAARSASDAKDRRCPRLTAVNDGGRVEIARRLLPPPAGGGTAVAMRVTEPGLSPHESVVVAVVTGGVQVVVTAPRSTDPAEIRRAMTPLVDALGPSRQG